MTQQDFLKNQVIEEIIRERTNFYINRKDCLNFWILMSPLFLESTKLIEKIKKTNFYFQKKDDFENGKNRYSSVIISNSYEYICWLKLRLGYFENLDEDLIINKGFRSDGLIGSIESNELDSSISLFDTVLNNIHPNILVNNYKKALDSYILNS
jgi:hypothetical protein